MVKCIRCNERIVIFSPVACVCDTCYAVDDLGRHAETPNIKPSAKKKKFETHEDWELVGMTLVKGYYQ